MVGSTNNDCVDAFSMKDDTLRQQLESVIDKELQDLGFANLCKKIALRVVEKVQKIDKEHEEIKNIYVDLGARLANLLADDETPYTAATGTTSPSSSSTTQSNSSKTKDSKSNDDCVIVIDDDDDEEEDANKDNNSDDHHLPFSENTVYECANEYCVSSHSKTSPCKLAFSNAVNSLKESIPLIASTSSACISSYGEAPSTSTMNIVMNGGNESSTDIKSIAVDTTTKPSLTIAVEPENCKINGDNNIIIPDPTVNLSLHLGENDNGNLTENDLLNTSVDSTLIEVENQLNNMIESIKTISEATEIPLVITGEDIDMGSPPQEDALMTNDSLNEDEIVDVVTEDNSFIDTVNILNDSNEKLIDIQTSPITINRSPMVDRSPIINKSPIIVNRSPIIQKFTIHHSESPSTQSSTSTLSQVETSDTESQSSQSSGFLTDSTVQNYNRSPLILKIQKDTKTSESVNKYSSVMVGKEISVPSKLETEMMRANCNNNRARKKIFRFVEGAIVFARPCGSDIWYEAELQKEILSGTNKKQTKYQVQFLGGQRLRQKILLKSIAMKDSANIDEVKLGTRIVAGRPTDTVNSTISKKYKDISSGTNINVMFAGVVAELACEANRYRYLVFFDDGYAQYFTLPSLFLVVRPSLEVWNDVADDCQEFVKEYLQEYPYRPLVCTAINSTMQTEWNGEWWKSRVVSIDASLVKILFDVDKRSEWIYRGTTRLEPLFNHFTKPKALNKKKKKRGGGGKEDTTYVDEKITHPQFGVCKFSLKDPEGSLQRKEWNLPDVAFKRTSAGKPNAVMDLSQFADTAEDDDIKDEDKVVPKKLRIQGIDTKFDNDKEPLVISSQEASGALGALQMSLPTKTLANNLKISPSPVKRDDVIGGNVMETDLIYALKPVAAPIFKPSTPPKTILSVKKGPHVCDHTCIADKRKLVNELRHGIYNYLSIPFQLGWKRESSKKKTNWHRDIYYRAPCNRRIRNLSELTCFFSMTKCSNVCIDMFCFQSNISCRNQPLKPKVAITKIDDLSGGKETCPIVCVNEINQQLPNPIVYISERLKAADVMINTAEEFLVCCDCKDNCQDKSKCSCAQLTIESSNAIDDVVDPNAGYHYRRLKETLSTGIYECNQYCKCSQQTCYNRVVQNGIQLRLQVFMTENRGWGVRCIDDIPKGTFICTYTGQILTEHTANREGMDYGDEYLAELDHIEVVEKAKDDYESDVPELRDNICISSDTDSDSDSSIFSVSSDTDKSEFGSRRKRRKLTHEKLSFKKSSPKSNDERMSETNSMDSVTSGSIPASPYKGDPVAPCHVPIQRMASADLPSVGDSTSSGESTSEDQAQDSPMIDFSLSSPIHTALADTTTCPLDTVETLTEKKTEKSEKSDKIDKTITQIAAVEIATSISNNTNIIINKTFSGKAVAIKSTANKAYAHNRLRNGANKKIERTESQLQKKSEPKNIIPTRSLFDGDKQMYVIDAKCFGNVGRFMNHSCSPNLFVQNVMVDTHDLRFPWVAFFAQQNIQSYTELTWDYNYETGSVPGKILICKCGAKSCKGRLL